MHPLNDAASSAPHIFKVLTCLHLYKSLIRHKHTPIQSTQLKKCTKISRKVKPEILYVSRKETVNKHEYVSIQTSCTVCMHLCKLEQEQVQV